MLAYNNNNVSLINFTPYIVNFYFKNKVTFEKSLKHQLNKTNSSNLSGKAIVSVANLVKMNTYYTLFVYR